MDNQRHKSTSFQIALHIEKEFLIPASGLTIEILNISVHPRPQEIFQHQPAHSKNHFPEVIKFIL